MKRTGTERIGANREAQKAPSHSPHAVVGRINRVRGYMEARGFRVGRGTWINGTETLPTVDIDRLDTPEINGAWECYLRGDGRSEVWAMIDAAREALKRFAQNDHKLSDGGARHDGCAAGRCASDRHRKQNAEFCDRSGGLSDV